MDIKDYAQMMSYLTRPRDVIPEPRPMAQGGRIPFAKGTQPRTTAGTFDKVYNMAEIRKLGKELNVSEFRDDVKLSPEEFRSNVTKSLSRVNFYKNQFDSLSPKKQKEFKKDFMKQIAKHQDGGFYISAENRVPNAKLVKKYFPKATGANKIVTSINGILLNEFKNKGNVIKTSPKANANAIRVEDMRKITDPSFETFEGVQGTKGASLQHVASKNRMVTLNNLAYMDKVLNSSLSQNDKRIKIIENEVDRLIKAKPKNYVERVNALNNEGMALASGYIKKDGKIIKGPTAGYSEFRIKDPLNEKLSYFGKNDSKTILPDKDPVLIQEDANLIDKPVKDYTPTERKRAIEIAKKKQIDFKNFDMPAMKKLAAIGCPGKAMGGRIGFFEGQNLNACATKGVEKLKGDPGKLTSGDQANLRAISKSTKAARILKNVLGPAAILGEVLVEGGIAANKFMSEGVPIKQALGESYINKYVLGPKTQIDVEAERAKEFAKGEDFAMAERGRRMAPFMAQSKEADAQRLKEREQQMEQALPAYDPNQQQYTDQNINEYLKSIGQRELLPGEGTKVRMNIPQLGLFGTQEEFMEGGIASLNVKK